MPKEAVDAEFVQLKDSCLTKVDLLNQSIVTEAENALQLLIDLKTKMHRERIEMQEANDTLTE